MYGTSGSGNYEDTHTNITNSTIKEVLDNWYKTNIVDKKDSSGISYNEYVSTEAGFCNDRQTMGGVDSSYGILGYGTNITSYAPWGRLYKNGSYNSPQTPTLNCSQSNDLFTVSGSSKGNHDLIYPVGLITSDEVVLAGGFGGSANTSFYLYTGQNYWTMSPFQFDYGSALVFAFISSGRLVNNWVMIECGVRPVINLNADVTISIGGGTSSNPFVISS